MKIKIMILLFIIILISLMSSAKTCDDMIKDATFSLEKNIPGFKQSTILVTTKDENYILKNIVNVNDKNIIPTMKEEVIPKFYNYYKNKKFVEADDFLDKAIDELRQNNKLSPKLKEKQMNILLELKKRNSKTLYRQFIETSGPEYSKIYEYIPKADNIGVAMGELTFTKGKILVGTVPVKKIISPKIVNLKGDIFAYISKNNVVNMNQDLEDVAKLINNIEDRNVANLIKDTVDPRIKYLKIGDIRFKRVGIELTCFNIKLNKPC